MKSGPDDLAIFGGTPAFDRPRYVGLPNIGDRDQLFALLGEALDRRWLSNGGPLVREFERQVADLAGVRHCVATCNATAALELAIRAAGLTGEVIVPAFTFPATVHAVRWMGLTPVLCDVDPDSGLIDPASAAARIGPRTSGIIGVHLWGRPCPVTELTRVARRHGLALLFDAAQAFGSAYPGRPVGGAGLAEVFSFHATKLVNAFEGGAVVTDDGALAARVRAMHNFGIVGEDEVALTGTNAKMSEAAAAMGLVSLRGMPDFVARNRGNHRRYLAALTGVPGVELLDPDPAARHGQHYVVLRVDRERLGVHRDDLMAVLRAENVVARRYFYPGCHRMAPYRSDGWSFPHADALADALLTLPTGTAVEAAEIDRIAEVVRVVAAHAPVVAARLARPAEQAAVARRSGAARAGHQPGVPLPVAAGDEVAERGQ
ncbi:DegT/DnrJ/EryC1/StrS family aminotransferase [Plantactinospora endophytica]|uniref:dTDP-4-dehydro-6-deoxyglucose aminotransferase n=1 Tax=Plantactinospora endophytica TaxID=673535 RepID=A0ABQ4E0V3_9ACTN|nr:DegT/DnrJ/EryC1/StrS family aminotransferase [Plantactinospora endophytica]GIG88357.1 dTDP-4-dehydro-6-deoxyglucose aminotransferase [Plantactinospora endophytica]